MNTTTATSPTAPAGYWQDTQGNLVPEANVRDIDKLRDQTVRLLFTRAKVLAIYHRYQEERTYHWLRPDAFVMLKRIAGVRLPD